MIWHAFNALKCRSHSAEDAGIKCSWVIGQSASTHDPSTHCLLCLLVLLVAYLLTHAIDYGLRSAAHLSILSCSISIVCQIARLCNIRIEGF